MGRTHDLVIVGGGPAGLAAGLYAARMNLKTALVDRGPLGGQLLNTDLIEDYLGFESITGAKLAARMGEHARRFGLEAHEFRPVSEIDIEGASKVVRLEDGDELRAPALILASGGLPRRLGVPGERALAGRGVSYCAICDGAFFKGKELAVVGGGDAALEEADFLTRYATKVHIIHRRAQFRAQPLLQERARVNPKIKMIVDAHVQEIVGANSVEAIRYERAGKLQERSVDGVFIFVGFVPNSGLLKVHVEHDASRYLVTDPRMRTSVDGIWAVGDVRAQLTRQISTAAGDGTTAAVDASAYIERLRDERRQAA